MRIRILVPIFLLLAIGLMAQKPIPPKPSTLVNDYADMLTSGEEQALERKLVAYDDSTSIEIAVVVQESLDGEAAFDYSYRLAEAWGVGSGETNNGILLYIAFQDRQIFVQTGYGAEGFLPDALAKRIIENIIKPNFRNGEYYLGIDRATDAFMQLGSGEYTPEEYQSSEEGLPAYVIILILLIIVIVIFSLLGGSDDWGDGGGYHGGGRYDYDDFGRRGRRRRSGGGWVVIPGGGGWSGGGGGGGWSGGGGGFGGFGGGGFGGGGAGGSW
jgi:uncharacterized protein